MSNRPLIESDALAALLVDAFDDATGNGLGPFATAACMEGVQRVFRKLVRDSGCDIVEVIVTSTDD